MDESLTGWSAYERLVMSKLETLEDEIAGLDEKVTLLRIDVAQLKIKAGVWGAVAGMVPSTVAVIAALSGSL